MKRLLIILLCAMPITLFGQLMRYPLYAVTCTDVDAQAIFKFENDLTDEEGGSSMSGTVAYTNASGYYLDGYALNLNASGRYASVAHSFTSTNGFTIAFGYRKGTFSGTARAIEKSDGAGTPDGFYIGLDGTNSRIAIRTGNGSTSNWYYSTSSLSGFINQMNTVVVTFDESMNPTIYYNGSDVTGTGTIITDMSLSEPLMAGSQYSYFWGYLDELQVSDFEWTSSQVTTWNSDPTIEITDCL